MAVTAAGLPVSPAAKPPTLAPLSVVDVDAAERADVDAPVARRPSGRPRRGATFQPRSHSPPGSKPGPRRRPARRSCRRPHGDPAKRAARTECAEAAPPIVALCDIGPRERAPFERRRGWRGLRRSGLRRSWPGRGAVSGASAAGEAAAAGRLRNAAAANAANAAKDAPRGGNHDFRRAIRLSRASLASPGDLPCGASASRCRIHFLACRLRPTCRQNIWLMSRMTACRRKAPAAPRRLLRSGSARSPAPCTPSCWLRSGAARRSVPSSAKNRPSASMKPPSSKVRASPDPPTGLCHTTLPSRPRQVNRPRVLLLTANRWFWKRIGVCTSELNCMLVSSYSFFAAKPLGALLHLVHRAAGLVAAGDEHPAVADGDGRRPPPPS